MVWKNVSNAYAAGCILKARDTLCHHRSRIRFCSRVLLKHCIKSERKNGMRLDEK